MLEDLIGMYGENLQLYGLLTFSSVTSWCLILKLLLTDSHKVRKWFLQWDELLTLVDYLLSPMNTILLVAQYYFNRHYDVLDLLQAFLKKLLSYWVCPWVEIGQEQRTYICFFHTFLKSWFPEIYSTTATPVGLSLKAKPNLSTFEKETLCDCNFWGMSYSCRRLGSTTNINNSPMLTLLQGDAKVLSTNL